MMDQNLIFFWKNKKKRTKHPLSLVGQLDYIAANKWLSILELGPDISISSVVVHFQKVKILGSVKDGVVVCRSNLAQCQLLQSTKRGLF